MAMIAITTSNSIRVNPVSRCFMPQLSALSQAASMGKKVAGRYFVTFASGRRTIMQSMTTI